MSKIVLSDCEMYLLYRSLECFLAVQNSYIENNKTDEVHLKVLSDTKELMNKIGHGGRKFDG